MDGGGGGLTDTGAEGWVWNASSLKNRGGGGVVTKSRQLIFFKQKCRWHVKLPIIETCCSQTKLWNRIHLKQVCMWCLYNEKTNISWIWTVKLTQLWLLKRYELCLLNITCLNVFKYIRRWQEVLQRSSQKLQSNGSVYLMLSHAGLLFLWFFSTKIPLP